MKRPDWFLIGMGLAVVLAWLMPAPGAKGGSLHPELLNKLGVSLIFFLHGLTLSLAALGAGARNWRLHLLVQACTFLLCPLLGVLLLLVLGSHSSLDLRTGLFFLCALPSTVSSSVALTATAKGNVSAAVFNATLSSLLGVVLTPLWLSVVLGAAGRGLPIADVILDLLKWLVLPLFVGQLLRPLLYTSFCDSVQDGVWHSGGSALLVSTLASIALLSATMLIVWHVSRVLGFALGDRIVALFCGSKKTLASGVPMARLIFGAHPGLGIILLPIMLYHPLQLVVGGWLAGRFARSAP
jgi:solute carrier family 10 (sodium/bile acid cotransporter), member 7